MATHAYAIPVGAPGELCTYRLGRHPRHSDHFALLDLDGSPTHTFHRDATRQGSAGILRQRGLELHPDDTVTQAAVEPSPTRRRILSAFRCAAFAGSALAIAACPPWPRTPTPVHAARLTLK